MQKVTKTIEYGHTYYRNEKGQLHNETGPAIIYADGSVQYCINGKLHRIDGPAYIDTDGPMQYWINGKLHRIDGNYLTKEQFEAKTARVTGSNNSNRIHALMQLDIALASLEAAQSALNRSDGYIELQIGSDFTNTFSSLREDINECRDALIKE